MLGSVLVVEDDSQLLTLLRLTFKISDCQIYGASTGPEGLQMALEHKPNLIILDVMLPGMNGVEVCQRIKENPSMGNTTIVMLSAKTDKETQEAAFAAGAMHYWTKPFNPHDLIERVRELLEG